MPGQVQAVEMRSATGRRPDRWALHVTRAPPAGDDGHMSAPQQQGGDPARDAGNETGGARAVITDGLPSQLVDTDPDETTEWLESLDAVVDHAGRGRARYLMLRMLERSRQQQVGVPALRSTDYINTIPPEREPWFPGDEDVEGRIDENQLDGFRQEVSHPGGGLSSYPHPRLMSDFWEFPTVSMGLGPMNAIYQARFNRYLHDRGIADTSDQHVWAFLGDGEMDEPESLGAIGLAAREELDNLTFVVNCNLQRLDGPVRGNGKIIQEMESFFRGAGWNVIKAVWGREWDPLLAADRDGALVNLMNVTPDGDYQTYKGESGAYVREHFFGRDPRTAAMVEDMTDDQIWNLKRGGHDYKKLYAAYKAATEHTGQPTVILAKTVKGWTLGSHFEARNATHQMKKLTLDDLKGFRDRLYLDIPDSALEE